MESEDCPLPDLKWLRSFRRRVLNWYEKHARKLPWRGTGCCAGGNIDPYKVWVSEIMLQQTTTAAVESFYHRFLERFPNIQSLAAASESEVLRSWEGLGYYRRATQLHRAAQVIVSEHNAVFPNTYAEILSLPGIGRYTAGAICSIAYHQRRPILEANTIRLHARLLAYPEDPAKSAGNKLLWQMAELVLPPVSHPGRINGSRERNAVKRPDRTLDDPVTARSTAPFPAAVIPGCHAYTVGYSSPGQMNQALMDLGSMICTPKSPCCTKCPVAALCRCAEKGLQHVIPALKTEKNVEERTEAALVIEKNGKYLMMRYPHGVRWAGLWDFPRHELRVSHRGTEARSSGGHGVTALPSLCASVPPCEKNQAVFEEYCDNIKRLTGYRVVMREQVGEFRHVVTRYKITLKVFLAQITGRKNRAKYQTEWVSKQRLADLALSTTGRKIADDIIGFPVKHV